MEEAAHPRKPLQNPNIYVPPYYLIVDSDYTPIFGSALRVGLFLFPFLFPFCTTQPPPPLPAIVGGFSRFSGGVGWEKSDVGQTGLFLFFLSSKQN